MTFVLASFVLIPLAGQAQTSFHETFNSNSLPATLEESGGSPIYSGGVVSFPNNGYYRRYLRTLTNYNTTNFLAEVTVTVSSGYGGDGMGFFGVGDGSPAWWFFNEPRTQPAAYGRIMPNDFGGNGDMTTTSTEKIASVISASGDGTYRVRLIWNYSTQRLIVAVHKNYIAGQAFRATSVFGTAIPESYGPTNTRLFFGGSGNSTFDDLTVLVPTGTPGTSNCNGSSVSSFTQQFGSISGAATALGFPSVDALQSAIQSFCNI